MSTKLASRPKFKKRDQVVAAGVLGEVIDPDAGTVGGELVSSRVERLVSVLWAGESAPVDVRESLLTKRRAKR